MSPWNGGTEFAFPGRLNPLRRCYLSFQESGVIVDEHERDPTMRDNPERCEYRETTIYIVFGYMIIRQVAYSRVPVSQVRRYVRHPLLYFEVALTWEEHSYSPISANLGHEAYHAKNSKPTNLRSNQ